ncbi:nuclease domain-containing protein [Paracoccus sp. NGMCC 1.201697]|uniref:Nuclease domain-containing protein n=1 Tax=Paracoccus broussonetiae subsp. drimophilus TaxID=3373869 RepID=A0ABW7LHA0_9RHOB
MNARFGDLAGRGPLGIKSEAPQKRTRRTNPDQCDAIRKSARGEECTLRSSVCNHDPETTVFCHIRLPGDGMGRKPPDYFGFYGCSACHAAQEARDFTSGAFGFEDIIIALRRTQERLRAKGLLNFGG